MPYITKLRRLILKPFIMALSKIIKNSGELNYTITELLLGRKPKCYEEYNSLMGVMESCKLEFYRRAVALYEDEKIKDNGDVYK